MRQDDVKERVKAFILCEFLPGEDADDLQYDTALFSQGILDSLASLKLVAFLESEFKITIEPHEVDHEHLDTVDTIADLVASKAA